MCSSAGSHALQGVCGPPATAAEALTRPSPPTDRGAEAAPRSASGPTGRDLSARASATESRTSALPGLVRAAPRGPRAPGPRCRHPRAAESVRQAPRRVSRLGTRAGRGRPVRDSGGSRCLLPPAHSELRRPRGPPSGPARQGSGEAPSPTASREREGAPPGPRALGRRPAAPRRGDYFPRPPAPRPLSSRGGTLRAAPLAAGYSGSCATYKRSLCGAILSLSVCGSRVIPSPRAESEGRRRRRTVRGAAPIPAEPPPQAEDGRTPAAGAACSPEVLGRSLPYPSGLLPLPLRSQTSSRARDRGGG